MITKKKNGNNSIDKCINSVGYIHVSEYYSTTKTGQNSGTWYSLPGTYEKEARH